MKKDVSNPKAKLSYDKIFGYAQKITTKKMTSQNPSQFVKEFFFQLDLQSLVFSYKFKQTDPSSQKSYGYKQIIKFTIHLTAEEAAFATDVLKERFIFKLILETKNYLIICKSFSDLKMWRESFKIFFQRKNIKLANLIKASEEKKREKKINKNDEDETERHPTHIEVGKYFEKYLMKFSESFIARREPKFSRCRWTRKVHSCDKIYAREKTSSEFLSLPSSLRIANHVVYYKSKVLRKAHAKLMRIVLKYRYQKIEENKFLIFSILRFILLEKGLIKRMFYTYISMKLRELNSQIKSDLCDFIPKTEQKVAAIPDDEMLSDFTAERYGITSHYIVVHKNKSVIVPDVSLTIERPKRKNKGEASCIDVYHMQYPLNSRNEISPSINIEYVVSKNEIKEEVLPVKIAEEMMQEPEGMPEENIRESVIQSINRSAVSIGGEPHFGNIAIIAQRYNKIDAIDDWKEYINMGN